MAWYSYFLMNVPESFILLALPFVLFGISIKENLKSMLLFAVVQGASIFIISVVMHNPFKPFITFLSFYLLVFLFFRFHLLKTLVITLTTFVFLTVFEIIISLIVYQIIDITFEIVFANPLYRILASFVLVQIPMLLTILVILKFNLKIKLPTFLK